MNKKEQPQECDAELCCKATAELKLQVAKELEEKEDKALAILFKKQEEDEDSNTTD